MIKKKNQMIPGSRKQTAIRRCTREFVPRKKFSKKDALLTSYLSYFMNEQLPDANKNSYRLYSTTFLKSNCSFDPVFAFNIMLYGLEIRVLVDSFFVKLILNQSYSYEVFCALPSSLKIAVIAPCVENLSKSISMIENTDLCVRENKKLSIAHSQKTRFWEFSAIYASGVGIKGLAFCIKECDIDVLLEKLEVYQKPSQYTKLCPAMEISGIISLGTLSISKKDISSLSIGDVFVLNSTVKDSSVSIFFSNKNNYLASIQDNHLTILDKEGATMKRKLNDNRKIAAVKTANVDADTDMNMDINDMNIELSFDVGHISICLKELLSMRPGYILEMPNSYKRLVNIKSQNCRVAVGELVQVGDNLGVEITEIKNGIN